MDRKFKLISFIRIWCLILYLTFTMSGCGPIFGPKVAMGPGMMGPWGMGWFGGIFMILILLIVIVAVILLLPRLRQYSNIGGTETSNGKSNALEILKERYARGEIDKTEFEEKKKDLEES